MKVEALARKEDIEKEFLRGLRKKFLEEKFFYWFPRSVSAWTNLCRSKEYKNYSRSFQLSLQIADKVALFIRARKICWNSLGCGDGAKEILFLKALRKRGKTVRFNAVDFSTALLEKACLSAQKQGLPAYGYKADITKPGQLKTIAGKKDSTTQVFSLLGNTLGALPQKQMLRQIAQNLRAGDWFIVDGELYDPRSTFSGYENLPNRKFALAPILAIGLYESDGELKFSIERDPGKNGFYRVGKTFRLRKNCAVICGGEKFSFRRGETIRMPYSYKYERDAFLNMLAEQRSWNLLRSYLSADKNYIIALCRKF